MCVCVRWQHGKFRIHGADNEISKKKKSIATVQKGSLSFYFTGEEFRLFILLFFFFSHFFWLNTIHWGKKKKKKNCEQTSRRVNNRNIRCYLQFALFKRNKNVPTYLYVTCQEHRFYCNVTNEIFEKKKKLVPMWNYYSIITTCRRTKITVSFKEYYLLAKTLFLFCNFSYKLTVLLKIISFPRLHSMLNSVVFYIFFFFFSSEWVVEDAGNNNNRLNTLANNQFIPEFATAIVFWFLKYTKLIKTIEINWKNHIHTHHDKTNTIYALLRNRNVRLEIELIWRKLHLYDWLSKNVFSPKYSSI